MLFLQKCIDDCELETISKLNTYKISIKKTTEIHPGGTAPLQLYNMIFRKVQKKFYFCHKFIFYKSKKDFKINEIETIGSSLF